MQPYLLRLDGQDAGWHDTLDEALRYARLAVTADADVDPEIIDTRTGRACMVAASRRWREEIAAILGA